MNTKQEDFYQSMRSRIDNFVKSDKGKNYKWKDFLMLVPDMFHLLVKLSLDKRVNKQDKAILAIAVAYFFSPLDLIPEIFLGPIGFVDDLAVAAFAINRILKNTPPGVVEEHWAGEDDILLKTREIIAKSDEMLGSGLVERIKRMMG
jgi:uncharacterized membrane protein YkvA (DUF1232 family)